MVKIINWGTKYAPIQRKYLINIIIIRPFTAATGVRIP
ncbi:hypothetical protein [uncultured Mediterranean phage uvMED]|nr:hypothetical protein [uncultured Mediterranean phage uvMED]